MKNRRPEQFIQSFQQALLSSGSNLSLQDSTELASLAQTHVSDLSPQGGQFFSFETENQITQRAAKMLADKLLGQIGLDAEGGLDSSRMKSAWIEIVTDFHRSRNWGFPTQIKRPAAPKVDSPTREVASYFWTMFQALFLMKCVILFFGIKSAEEPSPWMTGGLIFALFVSFSSLIWFAIRKTRKEKRKAELAKAAGLPAARE